MYNNLFLLAANTNQEIFGQVKDPTGNFDNEFEGISRVIIVGIQLFFFVAAVSVLIYLLWGALDWINSGGDPERISAAQAKMTHAVIGLILVFVALGIFYAIAGPVLGIIVQDPNGNWIFKLPTIGEQTP